MKNTEKYQEVNSYKSWNHDSQTNQSILDGGYKVNNFTYLSVI